MLVLNQVKNKLKKKTTLDLGPAHGAADLSILKRCSRSALVLLMWAEGSSIELGAMCRSARLQASSVGVQLAVVTDGLTTPEILGNISNNLKHPIVACRGPFPADSICLYWMKPFFSICFTIVKINTWNELIVVTWSVSKPNTMKMSLCS